MLPGSIEGYDVCRRLGPCFVPPQSANRTAIDPVWWTPRTLSHGVFIGEPSSVLRTFPSSGDRWSSWTGPIVIRLNSPVSSSPAHRRSAASWPRHQTGCGSQTSPPWPRQPASSIWHSTSMPSATGSAGWSYGQPSALRVGTRRPGDACHPAQVA